MLILNVYTNNNDQTTLPHIRFLYLKSIYRYMSHYRLEMFMYNSSIIFNTRLNKGLYVKTTKELDRP